jgi:hypothetical protein
MSEIPKEAIGTGEAIKVSFAAVGAALHCVNAIPGTPFANDIEAAVEAAAPFLRKQFEDEQPRFTPDELLVLQRAMAGVSADTDAELRRLGTDRLDLALLIRKLARAEMTMREAMLANWPEKGTNDAQ